MGVGDFCGGDFVMFGEYVIGVVIGGFDVGYFVIMSV